MTTTDTFDMTPPQPPTAARRLRRSRTDRIGAGVAGGLGQYFGVDPVLFRVLFATAAFFGGAGVLGYLLAWAAIPEEGTERAPIDGWVAWLRRRRVPYFLVVVGGAFLFWLIAFSWWAPGPFVPVIIVVIILTAIFGRRARRDEAAPVAAPVSLMKYEAPPTAVVNEPPAWVDETRKWMREAREARRARLRRALPIRIATFAAFVVAMVVLGLIDASSGISLSLYFWFALAILGTGLLVGLALRRAPWSVVWLLVPAIIGTIGFAGTKASLRDGIGQEQWRPTATIGSTYRLAFGQGVLDLRALAAQTKPHSVQIDVAAGQVEIIAPRSLNLVVDAHVKFGDINVDNRGFDDGTLRSHGVGVKRIIPAPASATGPQLTVHVDVSDGNISLRHVTG